MRQSLNSLLLELKILRARWASGVLRERVHAPVFLIGCGRSGKSSLGKALALHPEVCFLDESRPLWIACFPQADIWTQNAPSRGGRLHLSRNDAEEKAARRLSALFGREASRCGGSQLVQALAANSFRVEFLCAAFEDAKFIHIARNGLRVAQDIAERADQHGWYGRKGHKWKQLAEYAAQAPATASLLPLCENNFDRGLLEWRLCAEAIQSAALPAHALLEIRYEDLLDRPHEWLRRAAEFIGLVEDSAWEKRAVAAMYRPPASATPVADEKNLRIGGAFLQRWL